MAKRHVCKVVMDIDDLHRPGMGGSTPVPLSQRVHVWLETAPALLEALNVKHVSLLTHSAGTIYTLNTLYHLRHILDPQRPFVAFMGMWAFLDCALPCFTVYVGD